MWLRELFEQIDSNKHAAFCFGRMNPPTIGHGQLINTVAQTANGGDYFIFTSQTQDPKKNPLPYETKVRFLRAMFPEHAAHIVYNQEIKTIMHVAQMLYDNGYRTVTFVAGSDRLPTFKEMLEKYNGIEGNITYYKFRSIKFVSSGDRDPDADGLAGISATLAREAAAQGNFAAFVKATGAGDVAKALYREVRRGMNIVEDAAGVGVIAKNQKMARDPRYSHSMTVDVRPNTPTKNAKALRLI